MESSATTTAAPAPTVVTDTAESGKKRAWVPETDVEALVAKYGPLRFSTRADIVQYEKKARADTVAASEERRKELLEQIAERKKKQDAEDAETAADNGKDPSEHTAFDCCVCKYAYEPRESGSFNCAVCMDEVCRKCLEHCAISVCCYKCCNHEPDEDDLPFIPFPDALGLPAAGCVHQGCEEGDHECQREAVCPNCVTKSVEERHEKDRHERANATRAKVVGAANALRQFEMTN